VQGCWCLNRKYSSFSFRTRSCGTRFVVDAFIVNDTVNPWVGLGDDDESVCLSCKPEGAPARPLSQRPQRVARVWCGNGNEWKQAHGTGPRTVQVVLKSTGEKRFGSQRPDTTTVITPSPHGCPKCQSVESRTVSLTQIEHAIMGDHVSQMHLLHQPGMWIAIHQQKAISVRLHSCMSTTNPGR
jgi:hypothetical protein